MLKCIAIDDEPMALEVLAGYCRKIPFVRLDHTFEDPMEAFVFLQSQEVDLVFADVDMPGLNGLDLVKSLPHRPAVIFTTGHPEHAVTGFELEAVDYLLKPIPFDRFLKAVTRAGKLRDNQDGDTAYQSAQRPTFAEPAYLFIKSGHAHVRLVVNEILYVAGEKNYVKFVTASRNVMALMSMDKALAMLPAERFVRIHRSYIVALPHVDLVEKHVAFIGKEELPIGEGYRKIFLKRLVPEL